MSESVTLTCRCGQKFQWHDFRGPVDLAEFLRCAIGDGWRRIDEEPESEVEVRGETEIVLSGQCGPCDKRERLFTKSRYPVRAFKSLREIIASRRRVA